jgi:hypothetical protein
MKSVFKFDIFSGAMLLLFSLLLLSVTNHYILTINFFDNSGEYLSAQPGDEAKTYDALQKYIYLSTILYISIKVVLIALIIYTALYLQDQQINFSSALNIVIRAEYIFLLAAVLKIVWFKYEYPNGTLSDWHKTYIFSALSIADNPAADWYYPLQTINLFEIAYWFLLAQGIYKSTSLTYDQSLRVVAFSYVPALFIWVATIAFCTVMLFPANA